MANKHRAKKVRAPYRRYVYRSSELSEAEKSEKSESLTTDTWLSIDEDESLLSKFINVRTVHVLTKSEVQGKVWPKSQFQKLDVLRCCLDKRNKEYDASIENKKRMELEAQRKYLEESQSNEKMLALPKEVIGRIFEILYAQGDLTPKFLRLSKGLFGFAAELIYGRPQLWPNNFLSFANAISSNKSLGRYVRELDLMNVNHSGKNASVAKLLKRAGKSLEVFVAPQTSFGLGPLVSLKNCPRLKVLDLRLVSESMNLYELFNSIKNLQYLTHLSFPRSSIDTCTVQDYHWPPGLSFLRISGGLSDEFVMQTHFPSTVVEVEFAHCPSLTEVGFVDILQKMGYNLKTLRVQYPMPAFKSNAVDPVFTYCPNLTTLEVSVDYMLQTFFDEDNLSYLDYERPLQTLQIGSSGMLGTYNKIEPVDLALAIDEQRLPELKALQVSTKLGWLLGGAEECLEYVIDTLEERGGLFTVYAG